MTITTRRIIACFFVTIFLIITPIVLLYTAGYRYNFTKNKLEKTGVLFLDSEPSGATILIDGKMLKKKTPAHLTALLPGEYGVELKKDGHLAWRKTLTVESSKTLFATQVFLPRVSALAPLADIDAENIDLSPSQKIFLIRKLIGTKTAFGLYLIGGEETALPGLFETHGKPVEVQWSSDSQIIIIHTHATTEQFLIIDVEQKIILSPEQFFDTPIQTIKVDYNTQDIVIVGTMRGRFRFNVKTRIKSRIDTKVYDDYSIQGGLLYAVKQNPNGTNLIAEEVATKNSIITIIASLPHGSYEFLPSPDNFILLKNAQDTIFLIQLNERPRVILETKADQISWKKLNGELWLLYHHNFELWLFNIPTNEKELITRLSTSIKKSVFLPDGEHVLFLSNNVMRLIELDNRGGRNVWIIEDLPRISDFTLNSDEFRLYLAGQSAQATNQTLYSREMK